MARTRDHDACPGALQVHQAADGALARIRLPGGMIEPRQLEALAHAATRFGSPAMELTSRGNIQIRGIGDDQAVARWPTPSRRPGCCRRPPTSGCATSSPHRCRAGSADTPTCGDWVHRLDVAIQAEPALAALPGRFWFGIDDGRGDVSGLGADVGAHVSGDSVAVLLAGRDTGVRVAPSDVVPTLISIARRFVDARETAWRIAELADATALVDGLRRSAEPGASVAAGHPPAGGLDQSGRRPHRAGRGRAAWRPAGAGRRIPRGHRRPDGHHAVALGAGLRPRRRRRRRRAAGARADGPGVRRELAVARRQRLHRQPGLRSTPPPTSARTRRRAVTDASAAHRHFVGCERACGSPPVGEVLIATGDGYRLRTASP